jgi:hypothetical protein
VGLDGGAREHNVLFATNRGVNPPATDSVFILDWAQLRAVEVKLRRAAKYICDRVEYCGTNAIIYLREILMDVYVICLKTYEVKAFLTLAPACQCFIVKDEIMIMVTGHRDGRNCKLIMTEDRVAKCQYYSPTCDGLRFWNREAEIKEEKLGPVYAVENNSAFADTDKAFVKIEFEKMFGQRCFQWNADGSVPVETRWREAKCCWTMRSCGHSFVEKCDLDLRCCEDYTPCVHGRNTCDERGRKETG